MTDDPAPAGGGGAPARGRRAIRLAGSLAIGLACLWVVFRGVELEAFLGALGSARPGWILAGSATFAAMHLGRAMRWGALIRPVKRVPARSYVSICSVGFLLLTALPLRLGELARPWLLHEREDVPFGASVATVVVERTLEVLSLAALMALAVVLADVPMADVRVAGVDLPLVSAGRAAVGIALVPFLGTLVAAVALGERAPALARATLGRFHEGLGEKIAAFAGSFVSSLGTLRTPRLAGEVLAWTVATWALNVATMWLFFRAFPALDMPALDGGAALVVLVVLVVGVMVPSGPAFIGTFELFIGAALGLYGVAEADAAAYAVTVHAAQLVVLGAFGVFFLVRDPVPMARLLGVLGGSAPGPRRAA